MDAAIRRSLGEGAPYELEFAPSARTGRSCGSTPRPQSCATGPGRRGGCSARRSTSPSGSGSRRRSASADRRKDEFLATLAHELRNPLAPIRTAVRALDLKGAQDPDSRRLRDMVGRQVNHLVRLVDDLLDVSRISRGKIALRRDRVELAVTPPAERLEAEGDVVRLTQVVANLLNNAAKSTPEGGDITLSVERDGRGGVIRVRDSGLGIPADMLDRVFDMFTQVNRHLGRARGGRGP